MPLRKVRREAGRRSDGLRRYSLERAGLVADANWARQARVMKGPAERILASLRRRIRNYLFWGVFFVALSRVVYMLIST
jgi:hypothetical protein